MPRLTLGNALVLQAIAVGIVASSGAGATEVMTCLSTWTWTFNPPLAGFLQEGSVVVTTDNNCSVFVAPCGPAACAATFSYPYTFSGVYAGTCRFASVAAQGGVFQLAGASAVTGMGVFGNQHWQAQGALVGNGVCNAAAGSGPILATLERQ